MVLCHLYHLSLLFHLPAPESWPPLDAASLSYPLALAAGTVSFLSPCVFPLVPAYAAYLSGRAGAPAISNPFPAPSELSPRATARVPLLANGIAFVTGFSVVFVALFYIFRLFELHLSVGGQRTVNLIAGAFVLVLAIQTMGVIRIPLLLRDRRVHGVPHRAGLVPSFGLGLTFGAGWTPCIGPQLGAILTVAQDRSIGGLPFMLVYCLGLALPFLVVALLAQRFQRSIQRLNRHLGAINIVAGGLLLVFGLLLMTNQLTYLSRFAVQSPFDL